MKTDLTLDDLVQFRDAKREWLHAHGQAANAWGKIDEASFRRAHQHVGALLGIIEKLAPDIKGLSCESTFTAKN